MRVTKLKIYLFVEIIFFIALLIFQIVYMSKGFYLNNRDNSLFISIAILHVLITLITFLYSIYLFYSNRNKDRIREDLFTIYFFFALIADIFFSFTKIGFIGHIAFVIVYSLLMFIRKAKLYEYIGVLSLGTIAIIILMILNKLTLVMGIDCFVAPLLLMNLVMGIINYIKEKNKNNLLFMIAVICIFLSDLSIGLSMMLYPSMILVNISCMLTWPFYIIACYSLNYYYTIKRNLIN